MISKMHREQFSFKTKKTAPKLVLSLRSHDATVLSVAKFVNITLAPTHTCQNYNTPLFRIVNKTLNRDLPNIFEISNVSTLSSVLINLMSS